MTNLQIKYLANCGLLVKSGKSSVLIDALNNDNSLFDMIDRETERAMIEGTGEWSDITAIAYTHRHDDHFDYGKTLEFMKNHRETILLLPTAVGGREKEDAAISELAGERTVFLGETPGAAPSVTAGDMKIAYARCEHVTYYCHYHYCLLISCGDEGVLVTADIDLEYIGDIKKSLLQGMPEKTVGFFNPIAVGRKKWFDAVDDLGLSKLFIYHVPSEDKDEYMYRKMAISHYERVSRGRSDIVLLGEPLISVRA
jgi:Predicted Zn-dependent hydrolases of the beta-lactamase fold